MIEYIKFVEDKAKNRYELALGVVDVKCTYVGPIKPEVVGGNEVMQLLFDWLKDNQYMGTVEAYANGRLNVYVREPDLSVAVGFLRYTPEV